MKKVVFLIIAGLAIILPFCSTSKRAAAIPKVNYITDVQPLINEKCAPCHTTGNKKKLLTFEDSKESIDDMIARVHLNPGEKGFMPFKKEKLSDSLINVLVKWKSDGLREK